MSTIEDSDKNNQANIYPQPPYPQQPNFQQQPYGQTQMGQNFPNQQTNDKYLKILYNHLLKIFHQLFKKE